MTEEESIEGVINREERFPSSVRTEVTDVQICRGIMGRGGEKGRGMVDGSSEFPSKLDRESFKYGRASRKYCQIRSIPLRGFF